MALEQLKQQDKKYAQRIKDENMEKRIINGNGNYFEHIDTVYINEEEMVNIDVMSKNVKYEKAIKEAIELLSKEGINSKQKVKKLLEEVIEDE